MNKKITAILFALLAAALYAINIPFSKWLLGHIEPSMMASYLYLGAGIGIGIISLLSKKGRTEKSEAMTKKDMPYVLGMIILDIAAPILLMFGLLDSASSNASLLNNFEIVCTSVTALVIFKEAISKKMWLAIALITASSFVLIFDDMGAFKLSWGAVLVLLATVCWGFENNCTRKLANKNVYHVVFLKGIFSGLGSLIVALCLGERFAPPLYIALSLILGFVAYGLSIYFYIKAQGTLGAAKTSAYYSVSPFIGTLLSFLIFKDTLTWSYFVGLGIMCLGTVIVVIDTLTRTHLHKHRHVIVHTHGGRTHKHMIEHSHEHTHYISEKCHIHKHAEK